MPTSISPGAAGSATALIRARTGTRSAGTGLGTPRPVLRVRPARAVGRPGELHLDGVTGFRDGRPDPLFDEDAVPDHEHQQGPEPATVIDRPVAVLVQHAANSAGIDEVLG